MQLEDLRRLDALEPLDFLQPDEERAAWCRRAAAALFAWGKQLEPRPIGQLDQLLVSGFDDEQVWQMLEVRNKPMLRYAQKSSRKLKPVMEREEEDEKTTARGAGVGRADGHEPSGSEVSEEAQMSELEGGEEGDLEGGMKDEREEDEAMLAIGEHDSDAELLAANGSGEDLSDEDEDSDLGEEEDTADRHRSTKSRGRADTKAVGPKEESKEDKKAALAKLVAEMDAFADDDAELQGEEADAMAELYADGLSDDEGESDADSRLGGEDGEENGEDGEETDEMGEEGEESDDAESENEEGEDYYEGEAPQDDGCSCSASGGSDDEAEAAAREERMSRHERQAAKLRESLSELERAQVAEKPWQLKGEVSAGQRPENSLLDTVLDFDQPGAVAKQALAPSEETAQSIDEIIVQRCKEGLWDDVIRRAALKPGEFKPKAAELSTEKSSKGLGEEYADVFEEAVLGSRKPDELEKMRDEARGLLAKLEAKLHPLFSFSFVPKPPKREVTIKANVPAIALEERMPTAIASSSALAPQEVYGAKRTTTALASKDELAQSERRAVRAKSKRVHKRREAEKTEQRHLRAAALPAGSAARRLEAEKLDAELREAKRKGTVTEGPLSTRGAGGARGGKDYTKSKNFFQGLQAQAEAPGGIAAAKRQKVASTKREAYAASAGGDLSGARFKL